jgi:hypothetical protein
MGSPITVSNLVVELSVGGGQVVGLLPSSDGFVHLLLKLQQTSFTVLSGVYSLNGGADTFSLQGVVLQGQDAQVIYRYNPTGNTYDMNLVIGTLTAGLSSSIPGLTISNPGEFFCMDCGFDLPQGTFPPTIPEPTTGLLVMAGVLGLAISGRARARAAGYPPQTTTPRPKPGRVSPSSRYASHTIMSRIVASPNTPAVTSGR